MRKSPNPGREAAVSDIIVRTAQLGRECEDPVERKALMCAIINVALQATWKPEDVDLWIDLAKRHRTGIQESLNSYSLTRSIYSSWTAVEVSWIGGENIQTIGRFNLITDVLETSIDDGYRVTSDWLDFLPESRLPIVRALAAREGVRTCTIPHRSEHRFRDLDVELLRREISWRSLGDMLNLVVDDGRLLVALVDERDLSARSHYVNFRYLTNALSAFHEHGCWTISLVDLDSAKFVVISDGIHFVAAQAIDADPVYLDDEHIPDLRARHLAREIYDGKDVAEGASDDPERGAIVRQAIELHKKFRSYDAVIAAGYEPTPTFWDDYFGFAWDQPMEGQFAPLI